jgi:hypothetical protein
MQYDLTCLNVAVAHGFDTLSQQRIAKRGLGLHAANYCFLEFSG